MRLRVLSFRNSPPVWSDLAVEDYARRFTKPWSLTLIDQKASRKSEAQTAATVLATEAQRVHKTVEPHERLVVLDERGQVLNSRTFSAQLGAWRIEHSSTLFVIGSADGLDPTLKAQAHTRLSLSSFTMPHELARLVFVEQLYRAVTILQGHPYHRD